MVPLAEYLEMDEDDREGQFPYVWMVDDENHLTRLLVGRPIVESCEDRRDFWTMLRSLAGEDQPDTGELVEQARQDVVGRMMSGLLEIAAGSDADLLALVADDTSASVAAAPVAPSATAAATPAAPSTATAAATPAAPSTAAAGDYSAPWIDTINCTACDECIQINAKIFEYNAEKKAVIKNPEGGPYKDLVKAAERCTARVIHPGLPRNRSEKGIEKWIKRGEKFN
jgi:pyruvate-ferredoxin/flavodoxin oxidoreductase